MRRLSHYLISAACSSTVIAFSSQYAYAANELSNPFPIDQIDKYITVDGIAPFKPYLQRDEPYYLQASGIATSDKPDGIQMLGLRILCELQNTKVPVNGTIQSTRNHEGFNAYDLGKMPLKVHYLFVAPQAGNYVCTLQAKNRTGTGGKDGKLILQEGSETTFASKSNPIGAKAWGVENDQSDFEWMKLPEVSPGNECTRTDLDGNVKPIDLPYEGDGANVTTACKGSVHIGTSKPGLPSKTAVYSLKSDPWFATGSSIRNIADIELTACYYNTGSCPQYAWGKEDRKSDPTTVQTRLMVEQRNTKDDSVCANFNSPYQFPKITAKTHHLKVYHDFTFGKSSNCNADSYFVSKLYVKYLDGNPVRIEDSRYSQNILMNTSAPE